MSTPLLHIAAFWIDGDQGDEIADLLAARKIEGTSGAVVTFSKATASDSRFRHTMRQLNLAEVNKHPADLSLIQVSRTPGSSGTAVSSARGGQG